MTTDLASPNRSLIGVDRLIEALATPQTGPAENYPPYNVEKTGDDAYCVTLAVAGFALEDLSITAWPTRLIVTGKTGPSGDRQYLYHGVAGLGSAGTGIPSLLFNAI